MNLSSFIREEKDLSDLEETQMNRCYDWLFYLKRGCKEDIENLEKRIPPPMPYQVYIINTSMLYWHYS